MRELLDIQTVSTTAVAASAASVTTTTTTTTSATARTPAGGTVTVTETDVVVETSFFRRRILRPAKALLLQGTSPDQLALTLAVGTACSLFPLVGTTTGLNLFVGLKLKLNQPILQTLNQVLGPLELACILLFVRVGEFMWGHPKLPISVPVLLKAIKDDPRASLSEFAWTAVHAVTAWAVLAPVLAALLYFPLRTLLRKIFSRRAAMAARAAAAATEASEGC